VGDSGLFSIESTDRTNVAKQYKRFDVMQYRYRMSVETTSKAELVENIKEWIGVDVELKKIQKRAKELRASKKLYTVKLVDIMKTNEIDCFDVNNGKLIYTKTKTRGALGKKQLFAALELYFKDDETNDAMELSRFILESCGTKETEGIRMK